MVSLIANVNRDPKKQRKPFQPADFFPSLPRAAEKKTTWQSMLSYVEHLNALLGGKDLRPEWKKRGEAPPEGWGAEGHES